MSLAAALANDIGLAPSRLELTVAPGGTVTETVSLATTSSLPQQITVTNGDWTLDLGGHVVYFPDGSLDHSASAWIEPEAGALLLEPDGVRDFRLTGTVPDDPSLAGTYQAMVFFQVDAPGDPDEGLGVVATTRIALTVYVTIAGTESDGSELVDLFVEDDALTFAVANIGNTVMRLGGFVELRNESGEAIERIAVPNIPVLRQSEREVSLPLPEAVTSGFYVALALVEDSRGGLMAGEMPFTVE